MFNFYRDSTGTNNPFFAIPRELTPGGRPSGFLAGSHIERRNKKGEWVAMGTYEAGEPCNVYVHLGSGQLVVWMTKEEEGLEEQDCPEDKWTGDVDDYVKIRDFPDGYYRLEGIELTRRELLKLLPFFRPDREGVIYPVSEGNHNYCFWEISSDCVRYELFWTLIGSQQQAEGPSRLYRVQYENPMRPGAGGLPVFQTGFCVGYARPVPGPEVLLPVDLPNLGNHWPVEQLLALLSPQELVAAGLAKTHN